MYELYTKSGVKLLKYVKGLEKVQLLQSGLTMKRFYADGTEGKHYIRKYLHGNKSTKTI